MRSVLRFKNPWINAGAIALIIIVLLILVVAPNASRGAGSTYSRSPDGYGAWYAYMQAQGTPVERWQKPFASLSTSTQAEQPATLIRIISQPRPRGWSLTDDEKSWVRAGNRLIVLGVKGDVTPAPFTTVHPTTYGAVKVQTRRRLPVDRREQAILIDAHGAIAIRSPQGQGEAIYVQPSYLAANAYQDEAGNFAFLAQLAVQAGHRLYIDEFIHGHVDASDPPSGATDSETTLMAYLARTPIIVVFTQIGVVLAVVLVAENQRFGRAIALPSPQPNNSRAYITALATVLHKAESSEFVVDVVGKREQLAIQTALGLGTTLLPPQELLRAWVQQTGRTATELEQVLRPYWNRQRLSEADLITWIARVQAIHISLPSFR